MSSRAHLTTGSKLRGLTLASVALVTALVVRPSYGQDAGTVATRLFEEGRAALDRGELATACSKFAQSQALAPRVGTLLNLALCAEQQGRLAQALAHWREAEGLAQQTQDDRSTVAAEGAAKLEPRVPVLVVKRAASAPAHATIRWTDGRTAEPRLLGSDVLGVELLANPGSHRVVVEATGREPRIYELSLAEGERKVLEVDAAPAAAEATRGRGGRPDEQADRSGTALTIAGFVVGGVGLVGLGVGAACGGVAAAKQSASEEPNAAGVPKCDAEGFCSPAGLELRERAIDAATASTVLFVVGGTLLAAGVTMVLFAPGPSEPAEAASLRTRLSLVVQPGGASLTGTF